MKYDALIYGRNQLERIVSIEPTDEGTEVFFEDEKGIVYSDVLENEYWILAHSPLDNFFSPLNGNLHYKFIKTYTSRRSFQSDRSRWKDKDIFSIWDKKESFLVRSGVTYYKGMKFEEVSCLSFDIETTGLFHDKAAKVLIISNTFRKNGVTTRKMFSYDQYEDDGEMLKAWCEWVREIDPSIMLGHNIYSYDLPYMNYVADQRGYKLILGRNDSPMEIDAWESKKRKDASMFLNYKKIHIYGREIIDTMFLAYGHGRKYESYGLKPIIKEEGLQKEGRVFYDASKIRINYKNPVEFQKIKEYALFDADDSLALYDLMGPPRFYVTQSTARSYQHVIESATGGQINSIMNRSYLQDNHSIPKITESHEFKGAISIGNPGIYQNVFKIDVASLYPSIVLQYDVCDTEKDPNKNFLALVKTFTERRLKHKKLGKTDVYYDNLQNAEKIFINSCYGFLGSKWQNFNSPDGAAFITAKGREILEKTIEWATSKGYTIINADTDSISFSCKDGSEITNQEELLNEINSLFPEKIKFEHDGYYKKVIVVKIKNYILFDGKEIKHKGSSLKATTKEPALKEFINEIIDTMITSEYDFVNIYNKYVKEIMNVKDISRWGTRKTITDTVLKGLRTNEKKVATAIQGLEYSEGDRAYFYYKSDESLNVIENFDGNYDKDRLLSKLYLTSQVFKTIIDPKLFINYSLKRSKKLLEAV